MKEVELNIIALSSSESTPGQYALIFEEVGGFRRLPLIIGSTEAQAIAIALEKMQPQRPMTHDLFYQVILQMEARLKKVLIHNIEDDIFYAHLLLKTKEGELPIDARPSDAIALAVRAGAPIFSTEQVMDKAAIVLDNPSKAFTKKRGNLVDYSLEELQRMLENLLSKEDYKSAAKIRDAINRKKGNTD